MKRFWKEATLRAVDGGWQVWLDERAVKTRGGAPQVVPTRALGELLRAEWAAAGEEFAPEDLPLRDLADRAIDTARAGSPRRTPMAAISAAFSACSGVSSTVRSPTVASHRSGRNPGPISRTTYHPPTAVATTSPRARRAPTALLAGFTPPWSGTGPSQFLCRSALSAMPSPFHGTASTAPETELRRKSTLLAPESSEALMTAPSSTPATPRTVTLVPAVT